MSTGYEPPNGGEQRPDAQTDQIFRPSTGAHTLRQRANEETTLLTPVSDKTGALDRLPISMRKRLIVTAGAAAGVALILLGLTIYLWISTNQWQQRSSDLEDAAYKIGDQLAEEQSVVVTKQQELDLTREQLKTAQDRLLELAGEKAQQADTAAAAEERLATLEKLASVGGSVSLALTRCANEQESLVGFLKDPGAYDAQELADYEDSVAQLCKDAKDAATEYQKQLVK